MGASVPSDGPLDTRCPDTGFVAASQGHACPLHGPSLPLHSVPAGDTATWVGRACGGEKGNPGHTSPWQPNTLAAGGARQERRGLKETTETPTHCTSWNEYQGNASAREERAQAPRQSGAVGDDPQARSELHATTPGNNSRLLGNGDNAYYEDCGDVEERTTK